MPRTPAISLLMRRMMSLALRLRSLRGLRLISKRPLLSVVLVPSTPIKDDRLTTSGSFRMASASACWRSAIAAKETEEGASLMPWIRPVSWTGKNPFGITM